VNANRLILALLGAILISGTCTLLLGRNISRRASKTGPKVQYVAVAAPIAAGEIVKQEQLSLIDWPVSQPVAGAFGKADQVVGRAAVYPMDKGQIVLDQYLAAPGSSMGLTTKIPNGMRAIALKSDEVVGVAGFLFPGSRVDVLVTYRPPQGNDPITSTVMQNAQVVAVGHQIQPDPSGKPTSVDVMTILADPQDAEKVVLASTQGTIHFVLRNGSDQVKTSNAPVQLTQLGTSATSNPLTKKLASDSPKKKPYVVETIMGDKQSSASFMN
jgi:pilus assembly protein CpaB